MKDFVRHIVNTVLAEEGKGLPSRMVQEISNLFAHYEEKYGFSIYGGDIANLAKFFSSNEFEEVVNIFKSNHALDILEKILAKSLEEYGDIATVKNSILEACKRLGLSCRKEAVVDPHAVIEEYVRQRIPGATVTAKKSRASTTIFVELPTIRLEIKLHKSSSRIRLVVDKKMGKNTSELYEVIDRVAEIVYRFRL